MTSAQLNIGRLIRRLFARRNHKDRFFLRVFADKKDLLDLYNSLNGTSYDNPDDIQITTLEDALYLSMKNDLSFIISSTINLYEHQSTVNPNMPLRGFLYFSRQYEGYIEAIGADKFSEKLIPLPTPQYVVFYNGRKEQADEQILRLSDAFIRKDKDITPALECTVRVININYGHNKRLVDTCKRLHDYAYFIDKVNFYLDNGSILDEALELAINECINDGVLEDILRKNRGELLDMFLTEYNEKEHLKNTRQEGYDDGLNNGRAFERARINDLNQLLTADNRIDDLMRSFSDKEFQNALLKEYQLDE